MCWNDVHWQIPLENRPTLLHMAVGTHGPNQVFRYRYEELWCVHLYRYEGELLLNGQLFPIRPGYAGVIPPGVSQEYRFHGRSSHTYAHFQMSRADEDRVSIPAMQSLGDDFVAISLAFERTLGFFSTHVRRAEVILWDILWQLTERTPIGASPTPRMHPAVRQTIQTIEMRLSEPVRVAELARDVDLSHNHLTRLFRAAVGTTVVSYIQKRRVQRARHLLLHSSMPIKAVAADVGIRDLHLFNKMIRRELGSSPRHVRASQTE